MNIQNRPRDWTYLAAFNKKDLPSLQEMVKHIRETHDVDMIERFNNNCEQIVQGSDPNFDDIPKPIQVLKTDDIVVNVGLDQCIRIIQGTSSVRWSHIALSNNGTVPVSVSDINIDGFGYGTIPIATYGWNEAKGMKLFFAVIVPQTQSQGIGLSGGAIKEMGIYNGTAAGPTSALLNREIFGNNTVPRSITPDLYAFASVILASCVIEFCPVA